MPYHSTPKELIRTIHSSKLFGLWTNQLWYLWHYWIFWPSKSFGPPTFGCTWLPHNYYNYYYYYNHNVRINWKIASCSVQFQMSFKITIKLFYMLWSGQLLLLPPPQQQLLLPPLHQQQLPPHQQQPQREYLCALHSYTKYQGTCSNPKDRSQTLDAPAGPSWVYDDFKVAM